MPPNGDCVKTTGHYNPEDKTHGAPADEVRHHGDLGNFAQSKAKQVDGKFQIEFTDRLVQLQGRYSVIGRAFVLHEGTDNLGVPGDDESLKTGKAGSRKACGNIIQVPNFDNL